MSGPGRRPVGRDRVRAATLVAPGRYEIRDYPVPDPAPGCAVVRMALSGICGTDKHTYQGYTTQYAGTEAAKEIPFPIIQGHENVGTVAAIGPTPGGRPYTDFDGQPLRVGDRVVVGANVVCGECYYCRRDFPYFACENMTDYGNNLSAATRRTCSAVGRSTSTSSPAASWSRCLTSYPRRSRSSPR